MSGPAAAFYYDFNSPYSYLAAERISGLFAEAGVEQPEWQPISFGHVLKTTGRRPWSFEEDRSADFAEIQRRADERGLPEVVYPEGWPIENYSLNPVRAAIYAKESGRVVSFSLACFRQVFAAGRDMSDVDNVLVAAAACELHPNAVLKGIETQSVKDKLRAATDEAIERGVEGIPTIAVGDRLFWGDDKLEEAVRASQRGVGCNRGLEAVATSSGSSLPGYERRAAARALRRIGRLDGAAHSERPWRGRHQPLRRRLLVGEFVHGGRLRGIPAGFREPRPSHDGGRALGRHELAARADPQPLTARSQLAERRLLSVAERLLRSRQDVGTTARPRQAR